MFHADDTQRSAVALLMRKIDLTAASDTRVRIRTLGSSHYFLKEM